MHVTVVRSLIQKNGKSHVKDVSETTETIGGEAVRKMNELSKKKFQVKVTKVYKAWSFAIGLSNSDDETYILINFYKWSIAIGRLYEYTTD